MGEAYRWGAIQKMPENLKKKREEQHQKHQTSMSTLLPELNVPLLFLWSMSPISSETTTHLRINNRKELLEFSLARSSSDCLETRNLQDGLQTWVTTLIVNFPKSRTCWSSYTAAKSMSWEESQPVSRTSGLLKMIDFRNRSPVFY